MVNLHFAMSRVFAACIILATFHGVISSPLAITRMTSSRSSLGQLEQRNDRRLNNIPIRLMRESKSGSVITNSKVQVSADEVWAIFIGTDGFQAHPGPAGALTAVRVKEPRTQGGTLLRLQDLGETATFSSPEQKAEVFKGLLTDVPALKKGNGVENTNLAYLNGIFAYLASSSVRAVSSREPPEEWMQLYNEMHAAKGTA